MFNKMNVAKQRIMLETQQVLFFCDYYTGNNRSFQSETILIREVLTGDSAASGTAQYITKTSDKSTKTDLNS